jgi:serine/threonine protein kinase
MFGVSWDGTQPVIVLEYCAGGSLAELLFRQRNGQTIPNEWKIELVRGIARGVMHLHKHNIVHRDLAARNILLTASGQPKISDFGTSRILDKTSERTTKSGVGAVCWMAPESIATRNYSPKSDVWSFGITVYEIVAQCEPHKNMNVLDVAVAIRDRGLTPTIPDNCPSLLREVMKMCWKKEPNERPTFETICSFLSSMQNIGTG